MNNYIVDQNRFKLSGPPQWWLRRLWEFDSSLVVVPSRQGFYYRLAQRRPLQLPEHMVNDLLFQQSDTQMLAQYGLVPITTILATANWDNPFMFEQMRRMAPWRMGGAEKVNAMIEQQEAQEELDRRAKQDEELSYLAKDAWKFYNKKIGTRTHLYSPKTKQRPAPPKRQAPAIIIP